MTPFDGERARSELSDYIHLVSLQRAQQPMPLEDLPRLHSLFANFIQWN